MLRFNSKKPSIIIGVLYNNNSDFDKDRLINKKKTEPYGSVFCQDQKSFNIL